MNWKYARAKLLCQSNFWKQNQLFTKKNRSSPRKAVGIKKIKIKINKNTWSSPRKAVGIKRKIGFSVDLLGEKIGMQTCNLFFRTFWHVVLDACGPCGGPGDSAEDCNVVTTWWWWWCHDDGDDIIIMMLMITMRLPNDAEWKQRVPVNKNSFWKLFLMKFYAGCFSIKYIFKYSFNISQPISKQMFGVYHNIHSHHWQYKTNKNTDCIQCIYYKHIIQGASFDWSP